jgi:hypothetical protein
MIINDEISYVSALTSITLVKDEDIVHAISNNGKPALIPHKGKRAARDLRFPQVRRDERKP